MAARSADEVERTSALKIAHFEVKTTQSRRTKALTKVIEGLKGVAGVVAVGSMGLVTVLYDEARTDAVAISESIVTLQSSLGSEESEADPLQGVSKSGLAGLPASG